MDRRLKRIAVGLVLGSCSLCFVTHAGLPTGTYSEPLSTWLAENFGYRLAIDKDCACDFVIKHNRREIREDYSPYRANGDFDGDMIGDVALVVVNKNRPDDFLILVFASRLANGKKPLVYKNMLDEQNLGGIGLATKRRMGRDLLLLGTLNAEGAETIHIPDQVP